MKIYYGNLALSFFKKNKKNKVLIDRILKKIKYISQNPYENFPVLKGNKPLKKVRVGQYRIIFEITEESLIIKDINHRRNIYEKY